MPNDLACGKVVELGDPATSLSLFQDIWIDELKKIYIWRDDIRRHQSITAKRHSRHVVLCHTTGSNAQCIARPNCTFLPFSALWTMGRKVNYF
jgi:hypothetical protein